MELWTIITLGPALLIVLMLLPYSTQSRHIMSTQRLERFEQRDYRIEELFTDNEHSTSPLQVKRIYSVPLPIGFSARFERNPRRFDRPDPTAFQTGDANFDQRMQIICDQAEFWQWLASDQTTKTATFALARPIWHSLQSFRYSSPNTVEPRSLRPAAGTKTIVHNRKTLRALVGTYLCIIGGILYASC